MSKRWPTRLIFTIIAALLIGCGAPIPAPADGHACHSHTHTPYRAADHDS